MIFSQLCFAHLKYFTDPHLTVAYIFDIIAWRVRLFLWDRISTRKLNTIVKIIPSILFSFPVYAILKFSTSGFCAHDQKMQDWALGDSLGKVFWYRFVGHCKVDFNTFWQKLLNLNVTVKNILYPVDDDVLRYVQFNIFNNFRPRRSNFSSRCHRGPGLYLNMQY